MTTSGSESLGALRIAGEVVDRCGEGRLEAGHLLGGRGVGRDPTDQMASRPVDDDLRNATDSGGDHRGGAGHGLEIDDAQRLVDRGTREDRGGREHLTDRRTRQHLLNPDDRGLAGSPHLVESCLELLTDLGGVRRSCQQDELSVGIEFGSGAHQMNQPLLTGDASHEDHRWTLRIHADLAADVGLGDGVELPGVHAVAHHVYLVRVEFRVGAQHVLPHTI